MSFMPFHTQFPGEAHYGKHAPSGTLTQEAYIDICIKISASTWQPTQGTYSPEIDNLVPLSGFENEPPHIEVSVPIEYLVNEFGVDTNLIMKYLRESIAMGVNDPSVFCLGSVAETVNAKYKLTGNDSILAKKFCKGVSDIDIVVPSELADHLGFTKNSSGQVSVNPYSGIGIYWHSLVDAPEGYDVHTYRVAQGTRMDPLYAMNFRIIGGRPFIRFTFNSDNNLIASLIQITDKDVILSALDPSINGVRAYKYAISYLADMMTHEYEDTSILDGIFKSKPHLGLANRLEVWTKMIEKLYRRYDPIQRPVSNWRYDIETRQLGEVARSIVFAADRLFPYFEKDPEKAIYLLGSTGILSLIMQSALILGNRPCDILSKYVHLYYDAMKKSSNPKSKYYLLLAGARFVVDKTFEREINKLGYFPGADTNHAWGGYTYEDMELVNKDFYKMYAKTALSIAELNTINYMGQIVSQRIHDIRRGFGRTWLKYLVEK